MRIWLCALAFIAASSTSSAPAIVTQIADEAAISKATAVIGELDSDRLLTDKDYALEILRHLEVLRASSEYSGEFKDAVDRLRMIGLMGAGRDAEAFDVATELSRAHPGEAELHYMSFFIGSFVDSARALEELERADSLITSAEQRDLFRKGLSSDDVRRFRRPFLGSKDEIRLARAAEALLNFGWTDEKWIDSTDYLRLDAIEGRLARGDVAGARSIADQIRSPRALIQLLTSRQFDAVTSGSAPLDRLNRVLADHAVLVASKAEHDPNNWGFALQRAQSLRAVGREEEALALLLPKTADLEEIERVGEFGFWIANEAAYSLIAQGRHGEAIALIERLLSLGIEEHPDLINMAINKTSMIHSAGQYREAAAHAEKLFAEHADLASDYGKMWMWEGAACGHLMAGEAKSAEPWLARLREGEATNRIALLRAQLCADDASGAAATLVRALESSDRADALRVIQDYEKGPVLSPARQILKDRLDQVVKRPDVQAAIAKHGHVLSLPLSGLYWGVF